jgi:hypothetical protein
MKKSILVLAAVIAVVAGGSAEAAHLITSADIQDGTIKGKDIHRGAISLSKLTPSVQRAIKNRTKLRSGAQGPVGPGGPAGAPGQAGKDGKDGRDGLQTVSSLASGSSWVATSGTDAADCSGTDGAAPVALAAAPDAPAAIGSDAVKFGTFATSAEFGSITTHALDGVKLKDLTVLDFDSFEQQAGTDYLRIFTNGDADDVLFAPNSQDAPMYNDEPVNQWVRYQTLAGTWRYDDDAGNGGQSSWKDIVAAHGDDTVSALKISAGCSAPGPTSAYVDHVVVGASGQETTYDFQR